MSVITSSALEPASEAFAGFCGTERQKRELRRRQLLALQNEQQPAFQNDSSGGDISDDMQVALPASSSQLPSRPPAAAASCDFKEADAVRLERCISSIDLSSESGRYLLMQEISTYCSMIVRVPSQNVVEGAFYFDCACRFAPALDSDMSPGQRQWFPKVANKRIVQLLLHVARYSETDQARALACSSLEHISFFESGRYVVTSENIVPVMLHLATHIREEAAVVSLMRIFPAFCCGIRTKAVQQAFVTLGCSALHYGCQHVELYCVAFQQLTHLTLTERNLVNDENRKQIHQDAAAFLKCKSLASVLIRAAQLDNLSKRSLVSLCDSFLTFSETEKGIILLSNDAAVSVFLRTLMKIDDFDVNFNMTCNLVRTLPYFPPSCHPEVLQVMNRCSVVAPYEKHPRQDTSKNFFNTNILFILKTIADHVFDFFHGIDGIDDPQQSLLSIFRPFAVTLLRMAASTDAWATIQDQVKEDNFTVYDKHHVLNCKLAVLHTASEILTSFHEQLRSHHFGATSHESACAQLLKLHIPAAEVGSTNSEFQSIESLLLSCLSIRNRLFRDVDADILDDHVKQDKLGLYMFRLLRLRSIIYCNDDVNLESNNCLIFATLSNLSSTEDAATVDVILKTAFSSRNFEVFFARNISPVNRENFHTISRIFSFLSKKGKKTKRERVAQSSKNPWMLATQCSVFNDLIDVLISTYSNTGPSGKEDFDTGAHLAATHASQAIFSRIRIVNWDGSEAVVPFNRDVALSDLAASACEAFHHQPGAFDIVCAHSRAVFMPAEIGITLSQVGLVPSGKVFLQERKPAPHAEIQIVDLNGKNIVAHFEASATLNDIACFVRDHRVRFRSKGFPKKSFAIVVNEKAVIPESSFTSVSLLKAGLLPSGSVSFQDLEHCCIGADCETCIDDFLCFAKKIISEQTPLFNSGTARSLISLLQCSLCYHAQEEIIDCLMILLPTCNQDLIASIRHTLFERIDQLSKVNIRCHCTGMELQYDEFFHRIKDGYAHTLLRSLLKLRALPDASDDPEFFEMVDRVAVSRTHLHRRTLWVHRDFDRSMDLTNALAELFLDDIQHLIQLLSQTSPQSPLFLRFLSKIMTIILNKCQDEKHKWFTPELIQNYVTAIRNARDAPSPCCTDAALIAAYIFSIHMDKENTNYVYSSKCIKAEKWKILKEHFCIVFDICMTSGAVLPPMLRLFSSFIEASCDWFGPMNLMQKRDLNSELGEARLNSLVSAALEMSSHSNYLFMDSAACFFKVMASSAQLSQRLTAAVPDAIILMLKRYPTFCVKHMAQFTAYDDKSDWQHVLQAFHAIVRLSHLEAAVLKPSNLEVLCQFYSNSEVMDVFHKIQTIPIGRQMIGASLHTISAVLNALNKGDGQVQSKAIKVLAAGLQAPASLVWRHAPGLKETLDHLVNLACNFFVVDGRKITEYKVRVDESHILFTCHNDLILLLESLICCSSKLLSVSGSHVDVASEAVFNIRDLMVFAFDLLRNGENITSDMKTCDAEIMHSLIRVLKSTPPSLVSEHILNHFDDHACSVPTWLLCALNAMANDDSCVQLLCSNEMMACFLKVGRNPVVSSSLETALTQEANENFLDLESLKPEFDWDFSEQRKKRARKSFTEYKTECLKYDALEQQRLNGLAQSRSLYQLIARITRNNQDVVSKEDFLRMLLDAVRPGTNLNAMDDILVAIRQIFGQQCRYDTHAVFNVATFSKLRRFLFVVLGQIQTISARIDASQYAKKVKKTLWSDICAVLCSYLALLLQIYPFRAFRRALTVTDDHSSHLGGKSIIEVVIRIFARATKISRFAMFWINPFDLFSRMLRSPVKKDVVAFHFPEIAKIVMHNQNVHHLKLLQTKQRMASFGHSVELLECYPFRSGVISSMVAFMSTFVHCFPRTALEQASIISSIGVFACRAATYVEPRIVQETCGFIGQLLQTPLSNAVYSRFASESFAELAAMCDFALLPSQAEEFEEPSPAISLQTYEKLTVVKLIEDVASFGPLSGDSITLALLRLVWGSVSYDEMQDIAPRAKELLNGMGVTKDNFAHVLPRHSKPIAANAQCYMDDLCIADEGDALCQVSHSHTPASCSISHECDFCVAACLWPRRPFLLHASICFYHGKMVLHGSIAPRVFVFFP